jgi:hypothetical protein
MTTKLPVRAVPTELLRKAWSEGHTYYPQPRREPRGIEKPIESMTLDELISTQDYEPLSESRRSFLTTGEGVHSLDAPASPEHIAALIDFVADDGPRCIFDAIENDEDPTDRDLVDDRRFIAYITPDFRTRDQILWEQYISQCGPSIRMKIGSSAEGRLTVQHVQKQKQDAALRPGTNFIDLARSAIRSMFDAVGHADTLDELHGRIDMLSDALDNPLAGLYHSGSASEERERYFADGDRNARYGIEHSSYERLPDPDWDVDFGPQVVHRSPRHSEWELWHNMLPRNSSDPLEMGMDLCSNDELESLLGVTAWDESGNALVLERAS